MIKAGQVRRWLHPEGIRGEGTAVFIVTRKTGLSYPDGVLSQGVGVTLVDHWEILCGGQIIPGWLTRTLETESVLVSE